MVDDEEYGDVSEAAAASGTSQSADKYDLGNKNEVMMLHELCAKKGIKLEPVLSDRMTADGQVFTCCSTNAAQISLDSSRVWNAPIDKDV